MFTKLLIAMAMGAAMAGPRVMWGAEPSLPGRIGRLPDGLGVNIHFTDPRPGEMPMLAEAGFKWVRMDFGWSGIERVKGRYDFVAYDRLMDALDQAHVRPVFILDYSNRFYDDDQSPHTEEGRAAFARWAAESVRHFQGRGVVWEMYNEPNITFWRPRPNVDDYAKLAIATGRAIREAAPAEIYIGPACSTMDFRFLESCFRAGCLEYWSAVSVHPYRQSNPETVAADYRRLRGLIAQYAPAGRQIPIVSGEWGYSASWKGYDDDKQGRYLPREMLTNMANDVPISIWYDWHDDGANGSDPEHRFGTVRFPYRAGTDPAYEPKPAYRAMRALSSALAGCSFSKRLAVGGSDDWVLLFAGKDGPRLAAWTSGDEHELTIPASAGSFRGVNFVRDALPGELVASGGEGLKLKVSGEPRYLTPQGLNDLLALAAAAQRLPPEVYATAGTPLQLRLSVSNPTSHAVRFRTAGGEPTAEIPPGGLTFLHFTHDAPNSRDPVMWTIAFEVVGQGTISQRVDVLPPGNDRATP